ncbi:uncharacterized protein LOC116287097 [Actinia tenebrosa]|uniref:Uncharacterized protein LOC116287097 n=1 Tax=Actinia tenebrosa TaxID=6105 RepID=A0A6P8HA52_ACTTE|nr:uncharacterized protein LOC116287097 [Actinia tenebrosa]
MMEDKKRKKFGLSLKNTKKLAVSTSEIKLIKEQRLLKTPSGSNSKEQKDISVLDARRPSCMEDCGLERKLKPSVNTLREENLVAVDNEEEHERILWKHLFSVNSSANWETMEDLPISVSEIRRQEDSNNIISSSPNLDFKTTQTTETFNVDSDYKDLPRPCITCYARKPCRLTWSQVDDEKRMENNDIYHINPSPKDAALDMNTSSIKMNLKNNVGSPTFFQKKTGDSLKDETNAKAVASINQNIECKKKFHFQNNLNKNKKVKNNTEGCFKSGPSSSGLSQRTTETFIDLTISDKPEKKSVNKQKFGMFVDLTYSTKEQSLGKQNNDVFHKTPSGLTNTDLKVKSEEQNSILGDSGAKGNVGVVRKEILKYCPICQFQFPQRMNKQGIDQHISSCIGNEELFVDDDEEDW